MSAELRESQQEYISYGFPKEGCIFKYETSVVGPIEEAKKEDILRVISEEKRKVRFNLDSFPETPIQTKKQSIPFIPFRHTFNSLFELRQSQLKKNVYG